MRKIFFLLVIFSLFSLTGSQVFAASLQIPPKSLPKGTFDVAYAQQIQAQGGTPPYTFSIKSGALPPGLDFSPSSGLSSNGIISISGTPAKEAFKILPADFPFTVRVIDSSSGLPATQNFSIRIIATQLKITNPTGDTVTSGTLGEPYPGFSFGAEGGIPNYVWSNTPLSNDLPKNGISDLGLNLSSDGKISGTPTQSGDFRFGVTVKGDPILDSSSNKALRQFKISIKFVPFEITTASPLSPGQKNSSYTATLSAHGGTPPYSWSIAVDSLPPGLDPISTNNFFQGIITGTPTAEGPFTFTVLVKDAKGTELVKPFSILIEKSCQCSDGTSCGSCKAGSPPLYCDGTTKTLINNPTCAGGGSTPPTPPSEGGQPPTGKLEVNWPNSPMGTPLNNDSKLVDLIKYLYEWGIGLGGFAAFIALIIAGFQYLTSVGNAGMMKDAMDRIRSAGLGLILLLASFLILNTINPQLTELKMPTRPSESGGATAVEAEKIGLPTEKCTGATLYGGIDYQQPYSPTIDIGKTTFSPKREIGSVDMKGNCQLILSQFSSCAETADSPSIPLNGDTSDVGRNSSGVIVFGCAKLSDSSFKIPVAP